MSELRARVAEARNLPKMFLLLKHGYFWRANSAGYTSVIDQAGRYGEQQAGRICGSSSGEVTMQPEPIPAYDADLNACAELRASLTEEERLEYCDQLIHIMESDAGRSLYGSVLLFAVADATAEQHCRAFLAAKGVA